MANKYIIPQHNFSMWKVENDDIHLAKDISSININTVWVADADMPLEWYDDDGDKHTINVKKNDIIISFYNRNFKHKIVVANSEGWLDNITAYKEYKEKEKADWAERCLKNSNVVCGDTCDACTDACSC